MEEYWSDKIGRGYVVSWDGGETRNFYVVGPKTTPHRFNGMGGAWYTITKPGGNSFETCDLWNGSRVPEEYWDDFPINAKIRQGRLNDEAV